VAFIYLKVKSAKCLCLLPVVLVLSLSLSWFCHFGLKNLVLFLSLVQVTKPVSRSSTAQYCRRQSYATPSRRRCSLRTWFARRSVDRAPTCRSTSRPTVSAGSPGTTEVRTTHDRQQFDNPGIGNCAYLVNCSIVPTTLSVASPAII